MKAKHLWLAVVALALLVREAFVLIAYAPNPMPGDMAEYHD